MREKKGKLTPNERSRPPENQAKRLRSDHFLAGLDQLDITNKDRLEAQAFGLSLVRQHTEWDHRERRRAEGVYSPTVERRARVYAKAYNLSMPRARLVASLDGGAQ